MDPVPPIPDTLPTHPALAQGTSLLMVAMWLWGCGGCGDPKTPTTSAPPAPPPPGPLAEVVERIPLEGICEPSGAAQDATGTIWIVDDDQDETLFSWTPGAGRPKGQNTALEGGRAAVNDQEGLALQHDTLWLLGSHSRNRKGKLKRRARLVSLEPRQDTRPTASLSLWPDADQPLPAPLVTAVRTRCASCTERGSWADLNIEGLTWSAHDRRVWLGLRAPLTHTGHAYAVALAAPEQSSDRVHAVTTLPLGDRGIRAMSPAHTGSSTWLVAGPPGDADPDKRGFAVFDWTPGQPPRLLARLPAFQGSPEAIVATGPHEALVFVDEGDRLKALALSASDAPHRDTSKPREPRFRCRAGTAPPASDDWAHAVRVRWPAPVSPPASIQ
mgnify:CR=1 FL=1